MVQQPVDAVHCPGAAGMAAPLLVHAFGCQGARALLRYQNSFADFPALQSGFGLQRPVVAALAPLDRQLSSTGDLQG